MRVLGGLQVARAPGGASAGGGPAAAFPLADAIAGEVGSHPAALAAARAGRPAAPAGGGGGLPRVAVIGHEGVAAATAGHLALEGFDVAWFSPRARALAP